MSLSDVQASLYRRHARLQKHLRSPVEGERVYGLEAVGRLATHEAMSYVEVAVRLLEDPSWSVRHAAAAFLAATPGAIALCAPSLEKLMRGADPSAQLQAAALLRPCLAELVEIAEATKAGQAVSGPTTSDVELPRAGEACARLVPAKSDAPATDPRPVEHLLSTPVDESAGLVDERLTMSILADRRLALAAVQVAGESLKYVAEEFRNDREIICTALHQCGQALRHAPEEFWGDRTAVLAAVAQDGLALRHATEELRRDPEVVATATGQNDAALGYACGELRDAAFLREVLGENTMLLEQWSATESAVFGSKGSVEPPSTYLAKRGEFIELMRDLASSIQSPDCWMPALTLLDALYCTPRMADFVQNDSAIAAVMLVGRMMNGRLNYQDQGPMIALHLGRNFELKEPDLKVLRSAEVNIFRALGGRLMLPSVGSWADAIFSRLAMLASTDLVEHIREAAPFAQRVAEVLALRVPASAKTPPSMVAVAACCATLVGIGMLPMDELMQPGDSSKIPTASAVALCRKLEGAVAPGKALWPDFQQGCSPRLDAAMLAKVVGGDVATLRANVMAILSAAA